MSFVYATLSYVHHFLVHLTGRPLKQLQRPGLTWGRRALELVLSISLAFSQTHELNITSSSATGLHFTCEYCGNELEIGKQTLKPAHGVESGDLWVEEALFTGVRLCVGF